MKQGRWQRRAARWIGSLTTTAWLVLFATAAHADAPEIDKAKDYFRAGAQAYAIGEYAAAVQAFEQANALAPRPALLFSIAQAERRQYFLDRDRKHLDRAIVRYREYLAADPQGSRKVDTVQALSELEPLAATLHPDANADPVGVDRSPLGMPTRVMISSSTPTARISLDEKLSVPSPLIGEVTPGKHLVRVEAPGFVETRREIFAIKGALVTLDVPLLERPAKLVIIAPEGAQVTIDGRAEGECPFPRPLELSAGTHVVALTKAGALGVTREPTLVRGETTVLHVNMRQSVQRTASLVMLGTGLSAFVAAAVFGGFSYDRNHAAQEFVEARGHAQLGPENLDQYNAAKRMEEELRTAALMSASVGAALAAGGALMFFWDGQVRDSTPAPEDRTSAAARGKTLSAIPLLGPGVGGVGLRGEF